MQRRYKVSKCRLLFGARRPASRFSHASPLTQLPRSALPRHFNLRHNSLPTNQHPSQGTPKSPFLFPASNPTPSLLRQANKSLVVSLSPDLSSYTHLITLPVPNSPSNPAAATPFPSPHPTNAHKSFITDKTSSFIVMGRVMVRRYMSTGGRRMRCLRVGV
jgi:hypothetical protein